MADTKTRPVFQVLAPPADPAIEYQAALYFLDGHYLFRSRENQGWKFKFVTSDDVMAAFTSRERDSGWLPSGIVRAGSNKAGEWFVYSAPAQKQLSCSMERPRQFASRSRARSWLGLGRIITFGRSPPSVSIETLSLTPRRIRISIPAARSAGVRLSRRGLIRRKRGRYGSCFSPPRSTTTWSIASPRPTQRMCARPCATGPTSTNTPCRTWSDRTQIAYCVDRLLKE